MQNSSQTTIHPIDASVQSSHAQVEVHNIADATGEPLDEVEWTQIKSDLLNKAFKRLDPIFKYGGKIQEVVNELDGLFEEMNEKFPCNTESISAFFESRRNHRPSSSRPSKRQRPSHSKFIYPSAINKGRRKDGSNKGNEAVRRGRPVENKIQNTSVKVKSSWGPLTPTNVNGASDSPVSSKRKRTSIPPKSAKRKRSDNPVPFDKTKRPHWLIKCQKEGLANGR